MNQTFWYERPNAPSNCPCLFLDRDGVVVDEVNYLHRPADVRLLPGARDAIILARSRGFAVGLVTNQAGIGRGYYDWQAFEAVQHKITELVDCGHDAFDFVAGCGAHAEAAIPLLRVAAHSWRKPNPGMMITAAACLGLDLAASIMVGDQISDIQAANAAGIGRMFHVATGHGARQRAAVALYEPSPPATLTLIDDLDGVATALGWR